MISDKMRQLNIEVEPHCHSVISAHAVSTLNEHISAAKSLGMKGLCLTNHGPLYSDGGNEQYFYSLKNMPKKIDDIAFFPGAEADIIDYNGNVDINNTTLASLKWVIASIHTCCLKRTGEEPITNTYLKVLENPYIDCLGHIGQTYYMCDFEKIVKKAKEYDKIIEINNSSLSGMRPGSEILCANVARLCKKYDVKVVVSSDAHDAQKIGRYDYAKELLSETDFPVKLISNKNLNEFQNYILNKRRK